MVRESIEPILRDENLVQARKRGGAPLIRPSETTTIEMELLEFKIVDKAVGNDPSSGDVGDHYSYQPPYI